MHDTRRNLLKMYVTALLFEGQLSGAVTPKRLFDAVMKALVGDLEAVSGEIIGMIIASKGREISAAAKARVERIAGKVADRFARDGLSAALGGLWADVKDAFNPNTRRGA